MAISDRTKEFLVAALADRKAAEEVIALLESLEDASEANDVSDRLDDLEDRVEVLEQQGV